MKGCRFHNPDFIAMYYDGALPKEVEKEFSDHLLTCDECMESLLNLENDLFSMHAVDFKPLPEHLRVKVVEGLRMVSEKMRADAHAGKAAVFKILGNKLNLISNVLDQRNFKLAQLSPVRGEERRAYKLARGGIIVLLSAEGENSIRLVVDGIRGKSISLKHNARIVEQHSDTVHDETVMSNLEKGSYLLTIDDEDFVQFIVY